MDARVQVRRGVGTFLWLLGAWMWLAHAEPSSSFLQATLERELAAALSDHADTSSDPHVLVRLADIYLDLGDEYQEERKRRATYEEGARLAQRALAIDSSNADAHYLYAANVGSAAQLKGVMASALTISDIKAHVRRALELKPDHAPALHTMGMMLEELPWFFGGDEVAALTYLRRAVAADPHDIHARLDLAKTYMKRRNTSAARKELSAILSSELPGEHGAQRYREEARQLFRSLEP